MALFQFDVAHFAHSFSILLLAKKSDSGIRLFGWLAGLATCAAPVEGPNCLASISPLGLVVIAAAIATVPGVAVALHGGWFRLFFLSYYIDECWAVERDT